jgi:ring-1,2-phenylacetyl-CoA epoxidase subunit PaaC
MNPALRPILLDKLLSLGDDQVFLAQRNGEWIGVAPVLEEDIAIGNLAQDQLGHGQLWFELYHQLSGQAELTADWLMFRRPIDELRPCQLLQYPRGDWAITMLRQYLFGLHQFIWTGAAREVSYHPVADIAGLIHRELRFHQEYSELWLGYLANTTTEARTRLEQALTLLWPLSQQLTVAVDGEQELVAAGIVPDLASVSQEWRQLVTRQCAVYGLVVPSISTVVGNRALHGPHLAGMVAEMRRVHDADDAAVVW